MRRIQFWFFAAALLIAGGAALLRQAAAAGEEVDIIVNKDNMVGDLPVADARKIFMGDKTNWPNGKRVTVLMMASGQPERDRVLHDVYKMTEDQYQQYFTQAAFAGKVSAPPKDVPSAAQMKQVVAGYAGTIGYVKKEDVDDSVKVVLKLQ